jgi:hypothetical protein
MISHNKKNQLDHIKIWNSVDRLFYLSKNSFSDFLDIIQLTSFEFSDLRKNSRPMPLKSLARLCEHFNLTMSSIVNGEVDFEKISKEGQHYLREKYSENAFSKCRTVNYLLYFIEKHFGWKKKAHILKHFQVDEQALSDLDRPINLKLSIDIGDYFLKYYNQPSILTGMGVASFMTNRSSFVQKFNNVKTYEQLYEVMCQEIIPEKIEKNYRWKIHKIYKNELYLKGNPDKNIIDLLGEKYVCGQSASLVREGFFSSLPLYINKEQASIKLIETYQENRKHDLYKINFAEEF